MAQKKERRYYISKRHVELKYYLLGIISLFSGVGLVAEGLLLHKAFGYTAFEIFPGAFLISCGVGFLIQAFADSWVERNYLSYDYE